MCTNNKQLNSSCTCSLPAVWPTWQASCWLVHTRGTHLHLRSSRKFCQYWVQSKQPTKIQLRSTLEWVSIAMDGAPFTDRPVWISSWLPCCPPCWERRFSFPSAASNASPPSWSHLDLSLRLQDKCTTFISQTKNVGVGTLWLEHSFVSRFAQESIHKQGQT